MSHSNPPWPVDSHVHFHRSERVVQTLEAAAENFQAITDGVPGRVHGALLLAQSASEHVFEWLREQTSVGAWRLAPAVGEVQTLIAQRGKTHLAVVCGRQVRADDGLEVLALGTVAAFRDGLPFAEAVAEVRGSGAMAVVPWGFGKWLGERGRRVKSVLDSIGPEVLYIGDNGSRLNLLAMPASIRANERRGFRVLPGTDPFPIGEDFRRVGGFGFMAGAGFDESAPWRRLRAWLVEQPSSPKPYGRASTPTRFVTNQVGIHLYKAMYRRGVRR